MDDFDLDDMIDKTITVSPESAEVSSSKSETSKVKDIKATYPLNMGIQLYSEPRNRMVPIEDITAHELNTWLHNSWSLELEMPKLNKAAIQAYSDIDVKKQLFEQTCQMHRKFKFKDEFRQKEREERFQKAKERGEVIDDLLPN